MLAALLLRANRPVRVGQLVEAVWERAPASPETNVRTYCSGLRRRLGAGRLITKPGSYLFVVHEGELDLAEFGQATRAGHEAIKRADLPRRRR